MEPSYNTTSITAPGECPPIGKEEQLTGQFTTLARHARVRGDHVIDLLYTREAELVFACTPRDSTCAKAYPEHLNGGPSLLEGRQSTR
jgi:hypothetical protein